ncbi:hypothetical protein GCM10010387_35240 [Streptomyces inusitatus]|uniref:AB hydrolase-1 domain-containing protein n=1 Tax=Streptomyces inusitatus TaxID=68221 RepID=A0A918QBE2_9ACTN|nr:alpha/beta fold hydrolase [Streptomyces inusitatus]GGZ38137.1 hypothetical protein GCM10010387_35240 [Streptomyces inusitatus]
MAVSRTGTGPADGHRALVLHHSPAAPRAAVLLLHGGRADALEAPPALDPPALRMRPFASAVVRAAPPGVLAVGRVRYRHRGWNGPREDAVHDARQALRALLHETGTETGTEAGTGTDAEAVPVPVPVPVVLVGHSMGGRAALRLAGDPGVRGVVALAPWCPPGETVAPPRDRRVIALHDPADRVTAADDTWAYLARAADEGAHTLGIRMPRGGHSMLRDARSWHRITTSLTLGLLGLAPLPVPLTDPGGPPGVPLPARRVLDRIDAVTR